MRVLIVSQWYRPEPEPRVHPVAEWLARRGHEVVVVTGVPNYPEGRVYPGYKVRWRQWERLDGVDVLRVPLFPSHDRSVVRRSLNYVSFALAASTIGTALCGPADAMWVYHPPLTVGVPALVMAALRRVPFVLEIQDMWPETLAATGMVPSAALGDVVGVAARLLYRSAAAITVSSEGFRRNLVGKGVRVSKVHVIPHWADDTIFRPVARDEALADSLGLSGCFNVVFAGNLGLAQGLDVLLDSAARLRDLCQVRFVVAGDGVDRARAEARARRLGLPNVQFLGRRPLHEMPRLFALADLLLVHLLPDPLFAITVPAKTVAYLASGRPILCAVAGEAAEVVARAGAGVTCSPGNAQALADGVRSLLAMPAAAREEMGRSGRRYYEAHHTRAALVGRYENLLVRVAEEGGEHLQPRRVVREGLEGHAGIGCRPGGVVPPE